MKVPKSNSDFMSKIYINNKKKFKNLAFCLRKIVIITQNLQILKDEKCFQVAKIRN